MPKLRVALALILLIAYGKARAQEQTYEEYRSRALSILSQANANTGKRVLERLERELPLLMRIKVLDDLLRHHWAWDDHLADFMPESGEYPAYGIDLALLPSDFGSDDLILDDLYYRYGWVHPTDRTAINSEQVSYTRRMAGYALADAHMTMGGYDALLALARDQDWKIAEPAFELLRRDFWNFGICHLSESERGWMVLGLMLYTGTNYFTQRDISEETSIVVRSVLEMPMLKDVLLDAIRSKHFGQAGRRMAARILSDIYLESGDGKGLLALLSSSDEMLPEVATFRLQEVYAKKTGPPAFLALPLETREQIVRSMLRHEPPRQRDSRGSELPAIILTLGSSDELAGSLDLLLTSSQTPEVQKEVLARTYVLNTERGAGVSSVVSLVDSPLPEVKTAAANYLRDRLTGYLRGSRGGNARELRKLPGAQKLVALRMMFNDSDHLGDKYRLHSLGLRLGSPKEVISLLQQLLAIPPAAAGALRHRELALLMLSTLSTETDFLSKVVCGFHIVREWMLSPGF